MSILNRLSGHLDDRALAAIWTDASIDRAQPVHPHLDSCALCRTRLAAFATWLDDLKTVANAEADEAFPPERLAAQKTQIMRRIEAAGRSARVIKFPRFAQPISSSTSQGKRWMAVAAACLIVGFGLGQFMDLRHSVITRVPVSTSSQAEPASTEVGGVQNASLSDEELMSRIEEIAVREMPASLVAFDSMTPRVQDYPH